MKPAPPATAPASRHGVARLAALATVLFVVVRVAIHPASDPRADARQALRRGADRLVATQQADGTWSRTPRAEADVATCGRPGLALVAAHALTGDPRHLLAARRAADAVAGALPRSDRAATTANLRLLVAVGAATGDDALVSLARARWTERRASSGHADAREAGRAVASRPNPTAWLDGTWRNFVLARAADDALLARELGEAAWGEAFLLEVAGSWAPKHDFDGWTSAAGRTLEALSGSQAPAASRLSGVHLALLRADALAPGIAWNETPYDAHVVAPQLAAQVRGMVACGDPAARREAMNAVALLAARQGDEGGWGLNLSLPDELARDGSMDAAPAWMAAGEAPDANAEVVLALAAALATPDPELSLKSASRVVRAF